MSETRSFRLHEEAYAGVGLTICRVPFVLEPTGLAGADVVIVGAPYDPSGITALAAHRVVLEVLSATASRLSGRTAVPQRPAPE